MSQNKSTLTSPESLAPTSPFSTHSTNLSTSSISAVPSHTATSTATDSTSPLLITQATYKKPTTKHVTQLTTSSAAGIAVANQVTPQRLANLLLMTGPLAIRHITSNLSIQISGFEKLSLSKQRRLIMNCLNQGFEEGCIVFQKIGWGQWSAKKVKPENFIRERDSLKISNAKVKDDDTAATGNATGTNNGKSINVAAANARRESITKNRYETDQHNKLLNRRGSSALLSKSHPISSSSRPGAAVGNNDFAILSDDEDEEAILSSTSEFYDDDESDSDSELSTNFQSRHQSQFFKLDEEERIPPLKLSTRSHNISPNSTNAASRRSSFNSTGNSNNNNNRSNGITKPKFVKHRSNSMTPTSPELRYYTTAATATSTNYSHHNNNSNSSISLSTGSTSTAMKQPITARRHSSIRSTLSIDQELDPHSHSHPHVAAGNITGAIMDDDTDEEDWESIGAIELLRNLKNGNVVNSSSSSQIYITRGRNDYEQMVQGKGKGRDEEDAASALLNLTRSHVHS
ncbi:hypothetical protein WICPIJ_005900 [Wickerhamomyces pijperi]|uniref:Protein STB3 n=2 Tax=Saccharomycotina TaxID=147537 RepID=A0A9P8Q4W8_WICPI|nr:hypothetical protein WICPIJ_005900 [Wickerhamomyces pijperi]